jgi:hypothetical protein
MSLICKVIFNILEYKSSSLFSGNGYFLNQNWNLKLRQNAHVRDY